MRVPVSEEQKNSMEVVRDYDEFCDKWGKKIKQIVASKGYFNNSDVEDITQELLTEFYAKDYLNVYDPELPNASKFSTFVYNFVNRRLLGKRDASNRHYWREGLSIHKTVDGDDEAGVLFIDLIEIVSDDFDYEFKDLCISIYEKLSETDVTSTVNDLPTLFLLIVKQLTTGVPYEYFVENNLEISNNTGRFGVNRKALAWEMGISESAISIMMRELRKNPAVSGMLSV